MNTQQIDEMVEAFIESGKNRSYLNDNNWTTHEIEQYAEELKQKLLQAHSLGKEEMKREVEEWAKLKVEKHRQLHGSIDCEACFFDSLLTHLNTIKE